MRWLPGGLILSTALLAASGGLVSADVFILEHGGRIEGELLNADELLRQTYHVRTPGGGEITLRTRHDNQWVIVEIEDNGPGIPEEAMPNLFDPFFTTKPPGEGTGLGLNISHNIIVQKHKGRIDIHTRPGRTCFEVRLPLDCMPEEQ